jgi:hypothetical protein
MAAQKSGIECVILAVFWQGLHFRCVGGEILILMVAGQFHGARSAQFCQGF